MEKFSDIMMNLAKIMDAWRVIPRVIVAMYGFMIYKLFVWYTGIPTHEEESCNDALVTTLIENGVEIDRAMEMACTIVGTVGGPTTQQTSFVTIIIGLSSAMFGFYVNSGGKWEFTKTKDDRDYRWQSDYSPSRRKPSGPPGSGPRIEERRRVVEE